MNLIHPASCNIVLDILSKNYIFRLVFRRFCLKVDIFFFHTSKISSCSAMNLIYSRVLVLMCYMDFKISCILVNRNNLVKI